MKTLQLSHTHTERNGGYIAYFKLMFIGKTSFTKMFFLLFKKLSFTTKILYILFAPFFLTWILVLKPFGKIFSKKTTYNGIIRKYDIYDINYQVFKRTTWKVLGIPYFYRKTDRLTKKDFEIIDSKKEWQ